MLVQLDIRDLAIVESISLGFGPGLTVLTGETGAGKSILIDAIGLLLGDRADSAMVRDGTSQADISGQWDLGGNSPAGDWLRDQALLDEDDPQTLLLRRVVGSDGRSRAFINGRPAPASALRELSEHLIEIHGQHAHQLLRKPEHPRRLLDGYGDYGSKLTAVTQAAGALRDASKQRKAIIEASQADPDQLAYLRHQRDELDQLALADGELDALESEHRRLAHAGDLLRNGNQAIAALAEDDDTIQSRLATVSSLLAELQEMAKDFDEAAQLVDQAYIAVGEATSSLRHAVDRIDLDPDRLAEVEQRMASIHDIARKHRTAPEALIERRRSLHEQVSTAENAGEDLDAAEQAEKAALAAYRQAAEPLSEARRAAATQLGEAVNEQLRALSMPDATLEVAVTTDSARAPSAYGDDDVDLLFSANPGQGLRPLTRVASGGELSRISLALQTTISRRTDVPVMIFDEVDVGVGGATAEVVGRLLRSLSDRAQILCVTHLPQVAAQGHAQINIRKHREAGSTRVEGVTLDAVARQEEIARMLGGVAITRQTRELAAQMLQATTSE